MNNVKFATYLHILTLLAKEKEHYVSSESIAGSVNVHAVIIRRALADLRNNGLIESKEGKAGGSKLAVKPSKIKLSDVYKLVNEIPVLGKSNTPNPSCAIGKQINKHLNNLYSSVEQKIIKQLGKESLADFSDKFK